MFVMTGIYWEETSNAPKHPKMHRAQPNIHIQQRIVQTQMLTMQKMTNSALGPGPLHVMACQPPGRPCFSQLYSLTMDPLPVV